MVVWIHSEHLGRGFSVKSQGPSCERSRPTNVWMKSVTLARTAGMAWLGWLCLGLEQQFNLWLESGWPKGPGGLGPSNDGYPIGNNLFHDAIQHKPQIYHLLRHGYKRKGNCISDWRDAEWSVDDTVVWAKCSRGKITFELWYTPRNKHGHQNVP